MSGKEALRLEDLLDAAWLEQLGDLIAAQPNVERYIGQSREWTIPRRENTFRALRGVVPADVRVVILGQDPYPREASAIGIAFNDYAIKKWTDAMNPSFLNIMKSVLASANQFDPKDDIKLFRKACADMGLIDPPAWFEHTQAQGTIWLNTSLTFSSKDAAKLKEHTSFWNPIVLLIFEVIIDAKKEAMKAGQPQGVAFIMWGAYAQKFKKNIQSYNEKSQPVLPIAFIENNHPAATGPALEAFHKKNSFVEVNERLSAMGLTPVEWFHSTNAAINQTKKRPNQDGERTMDQFFAKAPQPQAEKKAKVKA